MSKDEQVEVEEVSGESIVKQSLPPQRGVCIDWNSTKKTETKAKQATKRDTVRNKPLASDQAGASKRVVLRMSPSLSSGAKSELESNEGCVERHVLHYTSSVIFVP